MFRSGRLAFSSLASPHRRSLFGWVRAIASTLIAAICEGIGLQLQEVAPEIDRLLKHIAGIAIGPAYLAAQGPPLRCLTGMCHIDLRCLFIVDASRDLAAEFPFAFCGGSPQAVDWAGTSDGRSCWSAHRPLLPATDRSWAREGIMPPDGGRPGSPGCQATDGCGLLPALSP